MLVSTVTPMRSGDGRPQALRCLPARSRGRLHHGHAAGRVDVHHPGARVHGGLHCLRHRVGDVVELEVEEHARAVFAQSCARVPGLRA